ncbi:MAG: preprotein translocase subunit SecE [Candidatus Yanofskybacteria bacterium]|nr:preprotein translocase subunit SecE [Candidatus Yanofskybacteria bacterium]
MNVPGFLKDVRGELGRVDWPTKQQTIKYTSIVIGLSLFVAAFLGGLDAVFTFLLNKIFLR